MRLHCWADLPYLHADYHTADDSSNDQLENEGQIIRKGTGVDLLSSKSTPVVSESVLLKRMSSESLLAMASDTAFLSMIQTAKNLQLEIKWIGYDTPQWQNFNQGGLNEVDIVHEYLRRYQLTKLIPQKFR